METAIFITASFVLANSALPVGVLSWKLISLCRDSSGGQVLLYFGRYFGQIRVPFPRLPDGRPEQYPCNPQDEQLYFHLPGEEHPKPNGCELCAHIVEVTPSLNILAICSDSPIQSCRSHWTERCWKVDFNQVAHRMSSPKSSRRMVNSLIRL